MAEIVVTMNMISAGNPTMTDASMDSSSIKLSFDDRMYSNPITNSPEGTKNFISSLI